MDSLIIYINASQHITVMLYDDSNQNDLLNQSRFLVQEINLDEQPTEEEILERAEQLQIDDLILAKESLTKQLDPQWKPYCNRHGDIYYINLAQKLAYVDHPIDMFFKKQYARLNGLPIQKFKSIKIEKVSNSIHLIEEEIRNYQSESKKGTLRIVYEQPSQQQAVSSHPGTPLNYQNETAKSNKSRIQQLNAEEHQQLYLYEKQLQKEYEQAYEIKKKQFNEKIKAHRIKHQNSIKSLLQKKIKEDSERYEEELRRKNQLDMRKQQQKLQDEYRAKRMDFCQNIHKFNLKFGELREKQRNIQSINQIKNSYERMVAVEKIQNQSYLEREKAFRSAKEKILQQFRIKLSSFFQSSVNYQQNIEKSLDQAYLELNNIYNNINSKNGGNKQYIRNGEEKRKIFSQKRQQTENQKMYRDVQYQQLKKQIAQACIWQEEVNPKIHQRDTLSNMSSLNLRLRMRII